MTVFNDLKKILPQAGDRLQADAPLSTRSTFRIGGPADVLIEPETPEEVEAVTRYCQDNGIPLTVLGSGSNVLVSDLGVRGVVMVLADRMSSMKRYGTSLVADAGVRLSALAAKAAQCGLSGLEFASGIPGTLGGAILMNAGAYGNCMAEVVVLTEYLDLDNKVKIAVGIDHQFDYRRSFFCDNQSIILRTTLELREDDPASITRRITELNSRRRASQPLEWPSAGSAFKRPAGNYAGKLISDCGLKGCRVGNAQVSEKHAGFIVNLGDACAADTRKLFEHVQGVVAEKTGVQLDREVRFIGDWQDWESRCNHDKE